MKGGETMSIQPVGNSPASAASMPQKPQDAQEITTVTTHCNKRHQHDKSCPHTVSTRPAPKVGEPGYLLDERV